MKLVGNWSYPTSIRFGAGRIAELGEAAKAAGMRRPLLVTDPRLATCRWSRTRWPVLAADGVPADVFSRHQAEPGCRQYRGRARGAEGRRGTTG